MNLCGLGWQMLDEQETNQKPFVRVLFEQGQISEPMFSFSLSSLGSSGISELFIGELDSTAFLDEEIAYVPTVPIEDGNNGYWMVEHDISVKGDKKSTRTVVDSGTTLIALQEDLYRQVTASYVEIMEKNGLQCAKLGQDLFCGQIQRGECRPDSKDCTNLPSRGEKISIVQDFDDQVLQEVVFSVLARTVEGKDVEMELRVADLFAPGFQGFDLQIFGVMQVPQEVDFNLFGDVFMHNIYTVFSYNRGNAEQTRPAIGFGKKPSQQDKVQPVLI